MDRLSPERRSLLMSKIRGINTKPEMAVRRFLFSLGYRYSLHKKQLPGKPDIVFSAAKKAVFVHGCYWHGHHCPFGRAQSKSNLNFWREKLKINKERDKRTLRQLRRGGWK